MVSKPEPKRREVALRVSRVTLLVQRSGQDHVLFTTDLPSPSPGLDPDPLVIEFRCPKGSGREYLKKNFGWDPDEVFGDNLPPPSKFSKE